MHTLIEQFMQHLTAQERLDTVRSYASNLRRFDEWSASNGLDIVKAGTEDLQRFQRWLAEDYRQADGSKITKGTQRTILFAVKSLYAWMERRGLVLVNVARKVKVPKSRLRITQKDFLSLQEVTAMLQTQAARIERLREGCHAWAKEYRTLALLCIIISTGRRRTRLLELRVQDLNFERCELRIEKEKGKAGRVLPVAAWAVAVTQKYVQKARPVLDWDEGNDFLFPGDKASRLGKETLNQIIQKVHRQTTEENPDLTELAAKHLTPHCMRVSFAKLLFTNGCNIRSINELMLHQKLSTTAIYTPIALEELLRACRQAHPRA